MADQFPKYVTLLFSVCLWVQTCHSSTEKYTIPRDSLKPGDILNDTSQLCSAGKIFCMSFDMFSYYSSDPDFTYLRISNDTQPAGTIWVGNRNKPVVNNSGVLTLDHYGTLKIIPKGEESKPIEVLYSPTQPINNTLATLLDTGNLMLQELHPNGTAKSVLWQSFDYPTSTLLPGMKLGVDHKTRHSWSLVSPITWSNPASGDYTLEWESKNAELIIRARGLIYWKSGSYRSDKPFENIPEEFRSLYKFTIVSNEEEDYFTFTTQNKSDDRISYWTLNYDGKIFEGKTLSDQSIASADKCFGFDDGGGCQKLKNLSTCWSPVGKHVEGIYGYINFTDKRNLKYVQNDTNSRLTRVDCGQKCWSNCDCVGFYTIYDNRTGCTFLRRGAPDVIRTLIHPGDPKESQVIYLLLGVHREGKRKWIWRSAIIATSLVIICLFILCLCLRKRKIILQERKQENTQAIIPDLRASNESTSATNLHEDINKGHDLTIFSYESIMEATNNFLVENKLGQGGFGPVYKGILPTGQEVAIKRLSKTSGQGIIEFKNELTLICELQHMNLVQLLGCCIHKEERMLIYEYMPNKSLDFFLFDSTRNKLLDWQKRFNIIEGIAQGLLYLHKYSRLKVIHRDLKASNILLDENMNPKISDFGMARMFKQHESEANTIRIVGTYGYMSPEYAMNGVFSTKSDVFSFGVLLLEIVSGRRNNSFYSDDGPFNLVGHAWKLWKEGVALQLIDPALLNSYVHTEVLRCIHIALLCVEEDANDRPHMSNIISMLANQSMVLSSPKWPAFTTRRTMIEAMSSSKESDIDSTNTVTLSILDA